MLIKLLVVLICVPAIELYLLFQVHSLIGLPATLALIFLTAIAGAYLLRIQGMTVLHRLSRELSAGRLPGKELLDGVLILVGGILLLTPGFCTDLLGFLLLVPWTRAGFRHPFLRYLQRKIARGSLRIYH
jgi:UPF0716 protein FxsA